MWNFFNCSYVTLLTCNKIYVSKDEARFENKRCLKDVDLEVKNKEEKDFYLLETIGPKEIQS